MADSRPHRTASADTFVAVLESLADERPDATAFTYGSPARGEPSSLTYRQLAAAAKRIAVAIGVRARPGDRIGLVFPPGLEFIETFFGCLYAGLIAVPLPKPGRRQQDAGSSTFSTALGDAAIEVVATVEEFREGLAAAARPIPDRSFQLLAGPDLAEADTSAWRSPDVTSDTLAMLQYTSGSTGTPKGIRLRHRNLLANQRCIAAAHGQSAAAVGGGWLPMFHDMGLIGLVLHPVYLGIPCHLMSPADFLRRPASWLELVDRYRVTISPSPTFGYDYCCDRVDLEQVSQLDLSCWDCAIVGAEPVRPRVLERFHRKFERIGFRERALQPCFGMAEATLLVTTPAPGGNPLVRTFSTAALNRGTARLAADGDGASSTLVGCGTACPEHELRIVDPNTRDEQAAGTIGEMWIRGPSIADGYWERPELTDTTFHAYTSDGGGPFLRTGDLGFLCEGELFIAGRLKETIIVRGRQLFPEDVETTAALACEPMRDSAGVAIGRTVDEEERVVLLFEVDATKRLDWDDIMRAMRVAVVETHQVVVDTVVLVPRRHLPRTTSGKSQRRLCETMLAAGEFEVVAQWQLPRAGARS